MNEMESLMRAGWVNQAFGVIWVFGWVAVFVVLKYLNDRKKRHRLDLIHRERLVAMERGIPLPELPDYEEKRMFNLVGTVNPRWPLGVGAIFVLLGAGLSLALWLSGDSYHNQIWPFGLLGMFLGVGLFLHYHLTQDR